MFGTSLPGLLHLILDHMPPNALVSAKSCCFWYIMYSRPIMYHGFPHWDHTLLFLNCNFLHSLKQCFSNSPKTGKNSHFFTISLFLVFKCHTKPFFSICPVSEVCIQHVFIYKNSAKWLSTWPNHAIFFSGGGHFENQAVGKLHSSITLQQAITNAQRVPLNK